MERVESSPAAGDEGAPEPGGPGELVVYGAGWCPDVRRSRAVLEAEGVAYRYVDVEADAAATEVVRRLQHGARRIPTIVWPDGSHLVEPGDEELRARLG